MRKINVVSLFDGMAGARIALDKLGIECNYYASEIDKWAIKVAMKNYPDIVQLGDVTKVTKGDLPDEVDLLIGGSPCQSLSVANRQKESGLKRGKSTLFFEYERLLFELNPRYFLLENVASMKKTDRDIISGILGVGPVRINSSLVSAQIRDRLYWTNIDVGYLPGDCDISLEDIIENGYTEREKAYCVTATYSRACSLDYLYHNMRQMIFVQPVTVERQGDMRLFSVNGSQYLLQRRTAGKQAKKELKDIKRYMRKITPVEAERLQTVPENYTDIDGISNGERYKMLGNGFTIDVIAHILSFADFN